MNFLDAETDDADFRGAARVAMVLGMALESHREKKGLKGWWESEKF